jgi:hypothetical protein
MPFNIWPQLKPPISAKFEECHVNGNTVYVIEIEPSWVFTVLQSFWILQMERTSGQAPGPSAAWQTE